MKSVTRWIFAVAGGWVAATGIFGPALSLHLWSGMAIGTTLVLFGFSITGRAAWQGSLEALLGAWIAVTAINPPMSPGSPLCWSNLLAGLTVAVLPLAMPWRPAPATADGPPPRPAARNGTFDHGA